MFNLLQPRQSGDPEQTTMIKAWVRAALQLPEEATVMVTEWQCAEPGCPPLETVIAVWDRQTGTHQHKVAKPLCDVVFEDIAQLGGNV